MSKILIANARGARLPDPSRACPQSAQIHQRHQRQEPATDKINEDRYEELLGVSSHELYHTWNIKAIRPEEMYPYDYTKENYFKTGFVAEGVTTYMGDLMLHKAKHYF